MNKFMEDLPHLLKIVCAIILILVFVVIKNIIQSIINIIEFFRKRGK